MSRIATPATVEAAPEASRPLLEAVGKQLGVVPNLFRMVSNSRAALEGYVGMLGALAKGTLPAATHERIALTVAEFNECDYCLSAHTYLGKNVAKLDDAEIASNRSGRSQDAKADVELVTLHVQEHFARQGIGSALLHHAERLARGRASCLWLMVNAQNFPAIAFYRVHDFARVGTAYFELGAARFENHVLTKHGA